MLRLLRAQARQDRLQLIIWILGNTLFAVGSGSAVVTEFGSEKGREGLLQLAAVNPALLAIRGIPDGTSTGSVSTFELFTYIAIVAALMSTFMVVRHSRTDEERGRAELLLSAPIGRASSLGATILLAVFANLALAILLTAGFAATGLPLPGSLLFGLASGGAGLAFTGVAALAAQLAKTGRVANTIAGLSIALAWVLRAIGDAFGTPSKSGVDVTSAWPSWLSPIGWGQQSHPFGENLPWPLLLDVPLLAVTSALAFALVLRRDLGAGLVGDRPGRERGRIRTSFGLAWRLQRGGVIGWTAGAAVLGLFAGGLADPAIAALKSNPAVASAVNSLVPGGTNSLLDTFVAAIMTFLAVLAAGAAVQVVVRVRSEEAEGRTELLLAGRGGPGRSLGNALLVALTALVMVALAGGLVAGLAFAAAGHPDRFASSLAAAFMQLPAAAIFAAVAALVFAVLPRATVPLGWSLLAVGFVLGQFGSLLKLPTIVRDISPFTHTPVFPGHDIDWAALAIMGAIAVAVALFATALSRRRDLVS